jgi:hypothetical protein
MTVSEWILIILAALTLAQGTPAFIREIREMSSAPLTHAKVAQRLTENELSDFSKL